MIILHSKRISGCVATLIKPIFKVNLGINTFYSLFKRCFDIKVLSSFPITDNVLHFCLLGKYISKETVVLDCGHANEEYFKVYELK